VLPALLIANLLSATQGFFATPLATVAFLIAYLVIVGVALYLGLSRTGRQARQ